VRTLADIFAEFRPSRIDFLKVDVEGAEEEVLQGANWRDFRPRIVLVEATRPNTQQVACDIWESILTGAGYEFAWFDCLNRFYIRSEEPNLRVALARPPSYFDNFRLARTVELETRLEQALAANAGLETSTAELRESLERARNAEKAFRQRLAECDEKLALAKRELTHFRSSQSYRLGSWLANLLKRPRG
jgi:hypothetical protein